MSQIENFTTLEAWNFLKNYKSSYLVDVRTIAEWSFVGVPNLESINKQLIQIEWMQYPKMNINPYFKEQYEKNIEINNPELHVFFICRSGGRSLEAAKYIAQFGKNHYYNVIDGFEGNMDSQAQRNNKDGWKFNKLPWSQS